MDVIVRVQCFVLQTCYSVIFRNAMVVIVKVQWYVSQTWCSYTCNGRVV